MKINSHVQKLDARRVIDIHYKSYIHEGQVHLWTTMTEPSRWYDPEFSQESWEHVGSWPVEVPFTETAIEDIISEWLIWKRKYGWKMEPKEVAEIALDHLWQEAKEDNAEWDRRKAWEERQRVENFFEVLTA